MLKTTPKSHPENREEQEESTSKQRNRSAVKDVDKCTNLKNAQPMVTFATNANKASPSQGTDVMIQIQMNCLLGSWEPNH